jgi:hypothetical protein
MNCHKRIAIGVLMLIGLAAFGGTVNVEVDPPSNVDGTPLTDLAGIRVFYAPAVVTYTEALGKVTWQTIAVIGPTNQVWMPAGTNRVPVTATSGPYAFWAQAVASFGAESDVTSNVFARIGAVSTIKIKKVTP